MTDEVHEPATKRRLSGNTEGAAWLVVSAACTAVMLVAAKYLSDDIGSFQIVFVRAAASFVLVASLIPRLSWSMLAPRRPLLLFARSAFATAALCLLFFSVAKIPLADAQALNFASVVFVIPLSVVFLREHVGVHRWTAVLAGFVGVLIILRPTGDISAGAIAGAIGAASYASMLITVRLLSRTMNADAVYVWGIVLLAAMSAPLAAFTWTPPTQQEWLLLGVVGGLGATAQYAAVRAFAVGEASAIAPVDYLKLVFALIAGVLVFSETPDEWTLAGAALIVSATGYATWREARRRKAHSSSAS